VIGLDRGKKKGSPNEPGEASEIDMRIPKRPKNGPLLLIFAALLAGAPARGDSASSDTERGAELLAPFKRDLQQALRAGLAEGPIEAIAACQTRAPEIAAALSRDGARVGRTSHRLRNPANVSPDWARPVLEAYLADPAARAPRAVSISPERIGYVEPIAAQPLCLTCHGSSVAPDLAREIALRYPEDEAVGFEAGDLRGIFWIEFPNEAGGGAPPGEGDSQ